MYTALLDELRRLQDATFHPGVDLSAVEAFEREFGVVLPDEHRLLLQESNGVEVYGGYTRLFGIRTARTTDMIVWNRPDFWKFAWGSDCSGYLCFAETAWGDQFAYAMGPSSGEVYFLDALSMIPEMVASTFIEFWEKEFLPSAIRPYDEMLIQARQRLGPLEWRDHLVYAPSLLLGAAEDINNVQIMNARSAMICNGDIATQIDAAPPRKFVKSVQPYEDESHRWRLRLVWDDDDRGG